MMKRKGVHRAALHGGGAGGGGLDPRPDAVAIFDEASAPPRTSPASRWRGSCGSGTLAAMAICCRWPRRTRGAVSPALGNSVLVAAGATLVSLLLAIPAAFSFSRYPTRRLAVRRPRHLWCRP